MRYWVNHRFHIAVAQETKPTPYLIDFNVDSRLSPEWTEVSKEYYEDMLDIYFDEAMRGY